MDQVLCIDLSIEPARLALVSVDQRTLTIVESRQFSLENEFNIQELLDLTYIEQHHANGLHLTGEETSADEISEQAVDTLPSDTRVAKPLASLVAALNDLPKTWTNSVLVIPMAEYLSLNATLPFGDQKNLAKILDLEVQDVVPFEVDEFLVEGHSIAALNEAQFDVHISLTPKRLIRNILAVCRASGIEPSIVTTPCSNLATLPHLAPDYFKDTFALLSVTDKGVYLCASIDGIMRADKVIPPSPSAETDSQWFFPELKLSLMALEKRYGKTFATVYAHASKKVIADLQQTLGRTVEPLEPADFIGSNHKDAATSAFCALFAGGETPLVPLTNFRVREFSFRPNWGALLRALGTIKQYFIGFFALFAATIFITYQIRNIQISRLQSAVQEQIRLAVPSLNAAPGSEVPAFIGQLQTLSKELESIGSSNEISPMNILIEITKDLAGQNDTTINEIEIRPDRVLIEVTVPDYAAADRIERLLKRKKDLYRRIRKEANSYASASGSRSFNFELKLVD